MEMNLHLIKKWEKDKKNKNKNQNFFYLVFGDKF